MAGPADACSCLPPDLVRSYNQSDGVLRVKVLRERLRGEQVQYRARILTTYKGCLRPGHLVRLVTPASSALCGVRLEPGREYLVTGNDLPRRTLAVQSCGFNVPFETLSREQRHFLDTRFGCCGDACSCVASDPVQCFADPCQVATCPEAECMSNYCGGCNAEFYDEAGQAVCQPCRTDADCAFEQQCSGRGICLSRCLDLEGIDLGPCDAVLGWGLRGGGCAEVSGCDAGGLPIFSTREACEKACGR